LSASELLSCPAGICVKAYKKLPQHTQSCHCEILPETAAIRFPPRKMLPNVFWGIDKLIGMLQLTSFSSRYCGQHGHITLTVGATACLNAVASLRKKIMFILGFNMCVNEYGVVQTFAATQI